MCEEPFFEVYGRPLWEKGDNSMTLIMDHSDSERYSPTLLGTVVSGTADLISGPYSELGNSKPQSHGKTLKQSPDCSQAGGN
ncbi:hypothetical protein GN956_G1453 [Arapaima gigas]